MAEDAATRDLMNRIYARQRFIYDATRKHYLLGRDRLIDSLDPPPGGSVLEIGCGTARNLILAARRYPEARFHGIDVSTAMLATAAVNVGRAGLSDQIRLAAADASNFDPARLFGVAAFDRVFASYTLSMIPVWRDAIVAAMLAVAPDGRFHIVDFGEQEQLPGWFRTALRAWLRRFHVEPRAGLRPALESLCVERQASLRFASLYRGYAVEAEIAFAGGRAG